MNPEGNVVHNLFGKWNEAFYCGHSSSARCIWRQGNQGTGVDSLLSLSLSISLSLSLWLLSFYLSLSLSLSLSLFLLLSLSMPALSLSLALSRSLPLSLYIYISLSLSLALSLSLSLSLSFSHSLYIYKCMYVMFQVLCQKTVSCITVSHSSLSSWTSSTKIRWNFSHPQIPASDLIRGENDVWIYFLDLFTSGKQWINGLMTS